MPDVGLLLGLGLDPSNANDALAAFDRSMNGSTEKLAKTVGRAGKEMDKSLLSNHQSVHLLTDELGIRLPRAVVGAVSEMLPKIGDVGNAILAAFALRELVEFSAKLKEAAIEWGGYTEAVRNAEEEDIKASNAALTHFKTIAEGNKLIAETNRELAELSRANTGYMPALTAALGAQKISWKDLLGPASEALRLYHTYKDASAAQVASENKEVEVRKRLLEQLDHMTDLNKENAESRGHLVEVVNKQREAEQRLAMWRIKTMEEAGKQIAEDQKYNEEKLAYTNRQIQADFQYLEIIDDIGGVEQRRMAVAMDAMPRVIALYHQEGASQRQIEVVRRELLRLAPQLSQQEAQVNAQRLASMPAIQREIAALASGRDAHRQLTQTLRDEMGVDKQYISIQEQMTEAANAQAQAVGQNVVGAVQELAGSIAGLIGGRRAQAAVEMVFESAQGFKQVAMALDPDDPNHVQHALSAAQHFVAAAEYGKVAFSGGGHRASRSGVGDGRGSYGSRDSVYGGRSGGGDKQWNPSTLAPGAAGSGGRFAAGSAVVVVHGSGDAYAAIAGMVTEAANRGNTVTATSSMRGSPVGH